MTVKVITKYTKIGAIFKDGNEANANKDSKYSPELLARVKDCIDKMLETGIMLSPTVKTWDQDTYTLTLDREVTSIEAYRSALTFSAIEVFSAAEDAGWIFNGTTIE